MLKRIRIPKQTIPCSYVVEDRMSRSGVLDSDGDVYNFWTLGDAGQKTRNALLDVKLPDRATADCITFEELHAALDKLVSTHIQENCPFAGWAAQFLMDVYLKIEWE